MSSFLSVRCSASQSRNTENAPMKQILMAAVVAMAVHALLLVGFVGAFHGDPAALVCAGRERIGRAPYELIRVSFERFGYDGQFYYAIARSPWRRHDIGIDHAPGRQLRILYPAVTWILSAGDPRVLLWVMPAVNLLAIGGLAGVGTVLARHNGLTPWWGCLLPLAVNAALPALRDLTDVVALLSLSCLLATWLLRAPWWAISLAAAGSVFGREQNVAIVLVVLATAALQRRSKLVAGLTGVLVLWGGWVGVLRLLYGSWPFLPAQGNFGPPFAAMWKCWPNLGTEALNGRDAVQAACITWVLVQMAVALYLARKSGDPVLRLFLLAGFSLAALAGTAIYVDKWSFMRVLSWLPLGLWFAFAQTRRRWALGALALPALIPLAVVVRAWTIA
jgi:hypothetical protein